MNNSPYEFAKEVWGWIEPTETIIQQAKYAIEVMDNQYKTGEIVTLLEILPLTRSQELLKNALEQASTRKVKTLDAMITAASPDEASFLETNRNRILATNNAIQYISKVGDADITIHPVMANKNVQEYCDKINCVVVLIQGTTPLLLFAEFNKQYSDFSTLPEQEQSNNPIYMALEKRNDNTPKEVATATNLKLGLASGHDVILHARALTEAKSNDNADGAKQIRHHELMSNQALRKLGSIHEEVIRRGGTDIHISPVSDQKLVPVEARIHTRLIQLEKSLWPNEQEYQSIKKYLLNNSGAVSDGAELKREADGKYLYSSSGKQINVRAGFIALNTDDRLSNNNALIRLRLLPKTKGEIKLQNKGMPVNVVEKLSETMYSNSGLVLVAGPTGAGKSTTMLGLVQLHRLTWQDTKSRLSIEDPVEQDVPGIHQIQLKKLPGESEEQAWANILSGIVRMDPDLIVMGEVRNEQTANMAAQLAITGHMALATVHANNVNEAFERLINMPNSSALTHLIVGAMRAVIAQRLFPKLCQHCSKEIQIDDHTKNRITDFMRRRGHEESDVPNTSREVNKTGCQHCKNEGTVGVVPAVEILPVSQEVKAIVLDPDKNSLERIDAHRVTTMEEMTLDLIAKGLTPVSSLFLL